MGRLDRPDPALGLALGVQIVEACLRRELAVFWLCRWAVCWLCLRES